MTFLVDLLAATLRNATPLVYGTVGETYAERSGVLNLGIEGTMYRRRLRRLRDRVGDRLAAARPLARPSRVGIGGRGGAWRS